MDFIMKKIIFITGIVFAFYSCSMYGDQDDEALELNPEAHKLGDLQKILDGYFVRAIAFDSKGNAWIGTFDEGIIRYNKKETVWYHAANSAIPEGFTVFDMVVDRQDNVWIGGSDGLLKFDGDTFTRYDSQNTAMPEDVVWSIAVDSRNNIWLASCRFRQGGLVKYDGSQWTTYTPDNSALPDNSINSITIDQSDNVWMTVNDYVVKFSGNRWDTFDKDDLNLSNLIFSGIQFNSKNLLTGITDHSFNNLAIQPPCELFSFDGKKTIFLTSVENVTSIPGQTKITIDHNDDVWCYGGAKDIAVWRHDNNQLSVINNSEFGGSSVYVIKESPDNQLWFGTVNGIYIR